MAPGHQVHDPDQMAPIDGVEATLDGFDDLVEGDGALVSMKVAKTAPMVVNTAPRARGTEGIRVGLDLGCPTLLGMSCTSFLRRFLKRQRQAQRGSRRRPHIGERRGEYGLGDPKAVRERGQSSQHRGDECRRGAQGW